MKIGYAYVVGDILHFGHIQHLKNCKALCDKLIVGVLTDEAVIEKKPGPVVSFKERLELVAELKSVDAVVAQEEYSPVENIETIRPNVLFESDSHSDQNLNRSKNRVELYGGKMIVMPYFPEQSSSKIKEKIRGKS